MTGGHCSPLLLTVDPAVDRSQRQGHLQGGRVENATATGGGASRCSHPATDAQVSWRGVARRGATLRSQALLPVRDCCLLSESSRRRQCTVGAVVAVTTQAVRHQSGPLCPPTEVLLLIGKPWRVTRGGAKEKVKSHRCESGAGEGRNASNRGQRIINQSRGIGWNTLSLPLSLSHLRPPTPPHPEAATVL